jgi:hypothetical protein
MRETGKPCFAYYVGDFDPSGWQMARSLEQKLAEFGDGTESVELDAIHPDLLRRLVRDAIEQHVDHGQLEALRREEAAAREALEELAQAGFD